MSDEPASFSTQAPRSMRWRWGQLAAVVICLGLLVMLLLPYLARQRERANRYTCAENLRGFVQSMRIYAQDNVDTFPIIPNTSGSQYINDPSATGQHPMTTDPNIEIAGSYNGGSGSTSDAHWSSPSRCLWMLQLRNSIGVKSMLCKSDPYVTGPAPITNANSQYYGNYQSTSLSYSIAYPWANTATTAGAGGWWKNTGAPDIAVMCDMAPEHGTGLGAQRRNTTASKSSLGTPRIYNSSNHAGEGQNVAYADGHAEWTTDPYVGQAGDNIWTNGGTSFNYAGGISIRRGQSADTHNGYIPYDIFMVPVRNVADGSM